MAQVGNIWVALGVKDNATKEIDKIFGRMKSGLAQMVGLFASFQYLKSGVNSVVEMEDAVQSLEHTLGGASQALIKFADQASTSMGLSKNEFLSYSNMLAQLTQNMNMSGEAQAKMINDLNKRIADFASLKGLNFDEVFSAFQNLLAGREPMLFKQLGLDMSDAAMQAELAKGTFTELGYGLDTVWTSLDKGAQSFLQMQYFMKLTESTAGAFENSLDFDDKFAKLSAQWENLKVQVAEQILPMIISLVDMLAKHLDTVVRLIVILGATFAGFKLGQFVGQMLKAISLFMGLFGAKVAAQSGLAALATVPMYLGAIGGMIAGVVGASNIGGSGGYSTGPVYANDMGVNNSITVNVDSVTGKTSAVSSNGQRTNVQTNFGGSY